MKHLSTFLTTILGFTTIVIADDGAVAQVTMGYQAALKTHATAQGGAGAPCPTFVANSKTLGYVLAANSAGCCAPTATPVIVGQKAVACCPEGAHCTGFFPKVLDWIATNGKFAIASPTPEGLVTSTIPANAAEAT